MSGTEFEIKDEGTSHSEVPLAFDDANRGRSQSKAQELIEQLGGEVPVIFIGSMMVLVCAADLCNQLNYCEKELGFAVAAGTVSAFFCLVFMILSRLKPDSLPANSHSALAVFLWVWWTVSVCILTFDIPFKDFGNANGYIGTWLCFLVSTKYLVTNVAAAKGRFGAVAANVTHDAKGASFVLLVLSGVMLGASIEPATNGNAETEEIWALINSSVTIVLSLIALLLGDKMGNKIRMLATFLAVWCIGGALTTFLGPFKAAGNGYFSAIGCMITAMYMFHACQQQ